MPILGVEYLYADSEYGRVYIGFGKEALQDKYHGVWAFLEGPGLAQTIEFAPNQSRTLVIKELFGCGMEMLGAMHERGLLAEGVFGGK